MLRKNCVLMVLIFGLFHAMHLEADSFVVWPRRQSQRIVVIKKDRSSNFSDGFFTGMLFERFFQSHPVVALTTVTAFTAACIYAALSSAQKTRVEHTIVYIEDEDEDEDEIVYVMRS